MKLTQAPLLGCGGFCYEGANARRNRFEARPDEGKERKVHTKPY